MTSINKHGVINPILFREDDQGRKVVVAGERRLRAAKMLLERAKANDLSPSALKEYETIPAWYTDGDAEELALVENVQRDDLTVVEYARSLAKLKEVRKCTQEDLSRMIGLSRSRVAEILSISSLPEAILEDAAENKNVASWMLIEAGKPATDKAKINKWKKLKSSGITQGEYKAAKKAASASPQSPTFNVKSGLRLLKGTSTLVQKINTTDPTELSVEDRKNLRGELLALQSSLQAAISAIGDDK